MPCVRLPFYYGWLLVATAFITMGIGVNARTAFSLLFPPILGEFGWDRGVTAGAFSFGFLVSAVFSPLLGRLVDRRGPRLMVEMGVGLVGLGLLLATLVSRPRHLYLTLGVLVGGGRLLLWPLLVVRGAGAPDKIPDRDRLQSDAGRLGARPREPRGHSRPGDPRPCLRSRGSRVGVDAGQPGLRALLRAAAADAAGADAAAPLFDGRRPGGAGVRAHVRLRCHPGRDLSGATAGDHLRHDQSGCDRWRGG